MLRAVVHKHPFQRGYQGNEQNVRDENEQTDTAFYEVEPKPVQSRARLVEGQKARNELRQSDENEHGEHYAEHDRHAVQNTAEVHAVFFLQPFFGFGRLFLVADRHVRATH